MWVKVQFTGLQQEPAAIRACCLPMYEKHEVWSLLLVAYFCGFMFAPLSLLPLKSLPHRVQRKQSREMMLFLYAPMTKQQQLIGAVVWWLTDVTPAIGGQWKRVHCSHNYTVGAFSVSYYIYFNPYLGHGSSWPTAEVAAEKQNEVRGCWDEISAPSVKIKNYKQWDSSSSPEYEKALATQFTQDFGILCSSTMCLNPFRFLPPPVHLLSEARDVNVTWRKFTVYVCAFIKFTSFRPQHSGTGKLYYTEEHFLIRKYFCSGAY